MTAPLAGRVGIVTGASSGIGAAIARELAAAGMTVVLGARRPERLAQVADEIRARGGRADVVPTDMRDEAQVERLIATAAERHGQLDALVNNAALGTLRLVAEGRTDEWRAVLEANVLGPMIACRAALRHMLPRRRGDIVNVGSVSATESWPYMAAYAASKAALRTFSNALRAEVAPHGLRVMTLAIHNVASEFASSFDPALLPPAATRWAELGLLNRAAELLDPADVGRVVAFELSQPPRVSLHDVTIRSRDN